jgi:hypothetical protein
MTRMPEQYYPVLVLIGYKGRRRRVKIIPATVQTTTAEAAKNWATRQAAEYAGEQFQGQILISVGEVCGTMDAAITAAYVMGDEAAALEGQQRRK